MLRGRLLDKFLICRWRIIGARYKEEPNQHEKQQAARIPKDVMQMTLIADGGSSSLKFFSHEGIIPTFDIKY